MAKILIIGGTGFIGSFVTKQLIEAGHRVALLHRGVKKLAPPRTSLHEIIGDRNRLSASKEAMAAFAPEIIVDTILSSGRQARELTHLVNELRCRLIALSSMDVYRACAVLHGLDQGEFEPVPLTEDSRLRSPGPTYSPEATKKVKEIFGWVDDDYDKVQVERALLDHCGAVTTILRLPMVYGPGDPLHRVGQWLALMAPERKQIRIAYDYAHFLAPRGYVEEVAGAVVLAAEKRAAAIGVFNVAEEEVRSEIEFSQSVANAIGWTGELLATDDAPDVSFPGNFKQHWTPSSERIRSRLGYRERIPQSERLARSIAWERSAVA